MRGERFTDDHQADIRGLGTAFHCVRPELPLSSSRGLEQCSYRISQTRILLSQLSSHSFFLLRSVLVTRRCFHNSPYKAAEFTGDGGDGDVQVLLVAQVIEPSRETMLSLQCDGHHLGRLSLSAPVEDEICAGVMTVVPGCFDEDASGVNVTGLGDGTPSLAISA